MKDPISSPNCENMAKPITDLSCNSVHRTQLAFFASSFQQQILEENACSKARALVFRYVKCLGVKRPDVLQPLKSWNLSMNLINTTKRLNSALDKSEPVDSVLSVLSGLIATNATFGTCVRRRRATVANPWAKDFIRNGPWRVSIVLIYRLIVLTYLIKQ